MNYYTQEYSLVSKNIGSSKLLVDSMFSEQGYPK
jgi:hypothetical protein